LTSIPSSQELEFHPKLPELMALVRLVANVLATPWVLPPASSSGICVSQISAHRKQSAKMTLEAR
jgi:hypothetical protein